MIDRCLRIAPGAALVVLASALSAPATASQIFNFPNFTGACGASSQLTCVGSTQPAATADGNILRLTPAAGGQAGAAYSTTQVTLGTSATFSTTFQFRFTNPGGVDPADGITFVIAKSTNGLGNAGYGIGYAGSSANSVAIEFDTFNNSQGYSNPGGTDDTSSNHVAVDVGGVLNNYAAASPYGVTNCTLAGGHTNTTGTNTYLTPGCMSDGDIWSVTIGYDGSTKLLSVAVKDGGMAVQDVITNYMIDLAGTLGTNAAYVGFASGTGAGYENHDILDWSFASDLTLVTPPTPPSTTVPEPLPLTLVGIGLVGLAVARRRR